jgi:hypothetical protein
MVRGLRESPLRRFDYAVLGACIAALGLAGGLVSVHRAPSFAWALVGAVVATVPLMLYSAYNRKEQERLEANVEAVNRNIEMQVLPRAGQWFAAGTRFITSISGHSEDREFCLRLAEKSGVSMAYRAACNDARVVQAGVANPVQCVEVVRWALMSDDPMSALGFQAGVAASQLAHKFAVDPGAVQSENEAFEDLAVTYLREAGLASSLRDGIRIRIAELVTIRDAQVATTFLELTAYLIENLGLRGRTIGPSDLLTRLEVFVAHQSLRDSRYVALGEPLIKELSDSSSSH